MHKQILTKKGVKRLIKENRGTYKNQPDRIIADFRGERAFTIDYEGRQILELLQNADDAGSKEVLIEVNTLKNELSVYNNGEPFDIKGIKSLMIANLSSKNKKEFIGNKGLGFRSILNWASEVVVNTNSVALTFSPKIAKKEFESIVENITDVTVKNEILNEPDLPPNTVPFPILAIPKFNGQIQKHSWVTQVKIQYEKSYEQDIKDQLVKREVENKLTGLRPEILLFLNHIDEITIKIDDEVTKIRADKSQYPVIQINDDKWQIKDSGERYLEEEKKHYRIIIAWKEGLSAAYQKIFTYFPTEVSINLACIVHATFDLNIDRNYLSKTEANRQILRELVDMLKILALDLREDESDWLPFKLLTPIELDSNELLQAFYNELYEVKKSIAIFPCVDNEYRHLGEVKYYNVKFSQWIKSNEFFSIFPELLLAPDESNFEEWDLFKYKKYDREDWKERIDSISYEIESNSLREEILTLLLEDEFKPHPKERYGLLINKENEVIGSESVVFTPEMQLDEGFHIPKYLNLDFINRELYNLLIARHKHRFKQSEPESRELNRLFSQIVNLQPYDSNNVIRRIITGTREELRNIAEHDHPEIIKEMVQSVFKNFVAKREKKEPFAEPFPLLNGNKEVKDADELYLNSSFPSGTLTEDLYEDILESDDYLYDIAYYELDDDDELLVEDFFLWMGANKYVNYSKLEFRREEWQHEDYLDYTFANKNVEKPKVVSRYFFKGIAVNKYEETVAQLPQEKLLILAIKDEVIRQRLTSSHGDQLTYQYGQAYHYINCPSYISFQLNKMGCFDDYVIDTQGISFINPFEIDLKKGLFGKYEVKESDLKYVLSKLGAKTSIDEMSPERIYELLRDFESNDPEGKSTQQFYRLALNSLGKRDYIPPESLLDGLRVFAKCNGKKEWKPATEVYYSNDTVLPESILKDKFILNVPKRFGEPKVKQFLGVQLFNELKLNIVSNSLVEHPENESLKEELERLNKYILAIRIKDPSMQTGTQVSAAKNLKRAKLTIVESGKYTVDDGPQINLSNYEFINEETNFYLCADRTKNLHSLRNESAFCDAISEIYCIVFKVWEQRSAFRSAFIVGVNDLDHQFKKDGEEELLNQAGALLGLSQEETNFWRTIFKIKERGFPEDIDEKRLLKIIRKELGIAISKQYKNVDFENFHNQASYEFIKDLCQKLKINLSEIKERYPAFPTLIKWHIKQLNNELDKIEPIFGPSLWASLKDSTDSKQKRFIPTLGKLRPWFDNVKWYDLEEIKNCIEVDYSGILIKYTKENFGINVDLSKQPAPPKVLYNDLLFEYDIEESQLADNERSFLYFPEKNETLIQIFNKYQEKEAIDDKVDDKEQPQGLKIINTSLVDVLPKDPKSKVSGRGAGMHDPTTDKSKKRAGKKAEQLVRDQLVKEYGRENVQWVSGNSDESGVTKSDGFGYDFRYRKTTEEEFSYLEVKSVSSGSFIISYNEVQVGLKEAGKFHLGLVKEGTLHIETDFFTNKQRRKIFEQLQSNNSIRPRDYDVFFKLPDISTDSDLRKINQTND